MTEQETTPGQLVAAKTICLVLKHGRFGNIKQADLSNVEVETDKTLLRMSKTLLDSPELEAIAKQDRQIVLKIRALAFNSLFKGGVYLVPLTMVQDIEQILSSSRTIREDLVDKACASYDQRVDEIQSRLGPEFNPLDYPSVDRFRAAFYCQHSYVTFETPARLKHISAALFAAEAHKAAERLESVAEECEQTMRAGLLQLVSHLADRLEPTDDGKKKRLTNTTITHLQDFLETFQMRNVTDDAQLGAIVEKARAMMAGVDQKLLKTDEAARQGVLNSLAGIKDMLNPLIIETGTRAITLEDDV